MLDRQRGNQHLIRTTTKRCSVSVLLLIPRTATLGALVYFPLILNIFVITVSLHFTGTPVITGLMLIACIYLLCWDADKLKSLIRTD